MIRHGPQIHQYMVIKYSLIWTYFFPPQNNIKTGHLVDMQPLFPHNETVTCYTQIPKPSAKKLKL